MDLTKKETRTISEPVTESVVRGPREGFVENIEVNISLIRKRIVNPNLIFYPLQIGKQTSTRIKISYIEGIVDKKIVDEVKRRLGAINIDGVLDSGNIQNYIRDNKFSVFPVI